MNDSHPRRPSDPRTPDSEPVDSPEDPSSAERRRSQRPSPARRALKTGGIACAILAGVLLTAVGLLQFDAVGTAVARSVAGRVAPAGLDVALDRVSGSWIRSFRMTGLEVSGPGGGVVARVDTLALTWSLPALLGRRIALGQVSASGIRADLVRDPTGAVLLRGMEPSPPAPDSVAPSRWTVSLGSATVRRVAGELRTAGDAVPTLRWSDGGLRVSDLRLDGPSLSLDSAFARLDLPGLPGAETVGPVEVRAAARVDPGRLRLDTLIVRGRDGGLTGSGTAAIPSAEGDPGPLSLDLRADGFPLAVVHGALGRTPDPAARVDGTLRLSGTTRIPSAAVDLSLRGAGRLEGTAGASLGDGPASLAADLTLSALDPSALLADAAWAGRIDGRLTAALSGADLQHLGGEAAFRLDAVALAGLPLRSAQFTSVWDDGTASLELAVQGEPGTLGLAGTARPLDSLPTYDLEGPLEVDLRGDSLPATTAAGRLTVRGSGVTPETADATARLALSSVGVGDARLDTATVRARFVGGVLDWRIEARDAASGTLRASGSATPGSAPTVRVDSAVVRDLDVAGLLGDSVESRVDGRFDGSATLGAPDRTEARFDLAVRDARWGAVQVDSARAQGALTGGRLTADLGLRSSAGRLDGAVSARPFDDVPSVEVERLAFADVDAGAVAGPADSVPVTRLAGTLRGRLRGARPETVAGTFDVRLDSSRVNRQAVTGGDGHLRLDAGRVDAELTLSLPDSGRIALAARARPFADRPEIDVERLEFADLDPFALAGIPAAADARLAGRATATIRGLEPGTLDADVGLDLAPSRVNGETLPRGRIDAAVRAGRVEATADVGLSSGRFTADAAADLVRDTATWSLDARLRTNAPGPLLGADSLGGHLDATLRAEGRGVDLPDLDGRFHAAADSALLGDLRIDTARVAGAISGGFVRIDTLTLRSNVADVTGAGRVALADSMSGADSDLVVEATLGSLAPLEPWVGIRPLGLGEGHLRAEIRGAPNALRWTASAEASALLVGSTELLGLATDASGRLGPGLALRSFDGELHLDRLTAAGVEVRLSRMAARWDGEEITVEGDATVDDRRDVALSLRADLRAAQPRAELDRFDVRVDDDRWVLTGSPSVAWGDGVVFDSLALSAGDQSVLLDGRFDLAGTSDLEARLEGLRLGGLTDLMGLDRLDGTLSTDLTLQGPAADPRFRGTVEATLVRDGDARSRVRASLAYDTLLLDVDAGIDVDEGGTLEVVGSVPVDLALTPGAEGDSTRLASAAAGAVDLSVRADSFAVRWAEPFLDPSVVRGLGGHLEIDARVGGTQASPSLSGTARLRNGRLTLPTLGVTYQRARMDVALEGDRARIDSAQLRTDDGTLSLEGGVNLPELSLGEFDIQARLDRFQAIHNDAFRVRLSGTAELVGTTLEPRLEGDVQLVETDVYLDDAVPSGASVRPVELTDEEIRELEEYLGFSVTRPEREPGALFDALALNVAVSASRDTWIRQRANPQLEIQVTGATTVTKEPSDSLRFDGRIEAVPRRSWVEQFGRRFAIREGIVELRGTAAETRIDVEAAYEVPSSNDTEAEATITLDIEGTLDDLSLTLGSDPAMENADIVSYLATGRPASSTLDFRSNGEEGQGGGLRSIGSEFALGQVTGLVEGLAAEGVGLDVVEIRTDGLRGATLIAGRFVRPDLYVGFKQPVGRDPDDPDADSGFDRTEVELELQALRWLLLNMEASNSAVSFLFRFRYAY